MHLNIVSHKIFVSWNPVTVDLRNSMKISVDSSTLWIWASKEEVFIVSSDPTSLGHLWVVVLGQFSLFGNCIRYFSCCNIKMPDKSNSRQIQVERVSLGSQLQIQFIIPGSTAVGTGGSWCHLQSAERMQHAGSQFVLSTLTQFSTNCPGNCATKSKRIFPSQLR